VYSLFVETIVDIGIVGVGRNVTGKRMGEERSSKLRIASNLYRGKCRKIALSGVCGDTPVLTIQLLLLVACVSQVLIQTKSFSNSLVQCKTA
jgi:hypothetical protein